MLAALLFGGRAPDTVRRKEWKWMLAFAFAGAIGGRFPYACSEGLSATCRAMEWQLQLPSITTSMWSRGSPSSPTSRPRR